MAKIIPKLNLNKTPQLVENNSLAFAKNIRLLPDGTIGPDTSLEEIETNTGDATYYSLHHDEVTRETTKYFYTIMQYEDVLLFYNNSRISDNPEFYFDADNPDDTFDDEYKCSDQPCYLNVPETQKHIISCYDVRDISNPFWTTESFGYNRNDNRLENYGGLCLLIAIRKEIVDDTQLLDLRAPKFFYFVAPKQYIGTEIDDVFDTGTKYVVFNPLHQTVVTNTTIIQPAYDDEWYEYDTIKYVGQIVGFNNKIYFFKESNYIKFTAGAKTAILAEYTSECFIGDTPGVDQTATFDVDSNGYVTRNGILFRDTSIATSLYPNFNDRVKIFEYDEVANSFRFIECAWTYHGGEINGCVSVNGTGEPILTICESNDTDERLVPIKHININTCSENDDESFYTQAPNIPISNLRLSGRYINTIPAGVYQFFIRYKIRENFYTNWFPCSKELFAGSRKTIDTLQGSIKYTDLHEDSNNSFVFTIQHLYPQYCANYEEFQLGFIISSDGGIFARAWKHFDMTLASTVSIYFDYIQTDIEEINIDDLLKVNYNVFNVHNITPYKNKLYIANYIETNFNEVFLQELANQVKVTLDLLQVKIVSGYYLNNIPLEETTSGIFSSFNNIQIKDIYYDSLYCNTNSSIIDTAQTTLDLGEYPDSIDPNIPISVNPEIVKVYMIDDSNNQYNIAVYSSYLNIINENVDTIINTIIDDVRQNILGIDSNGNFIININGNSININNFIIEYNSYGQLQSTPTHIVVGGHSTPYGYEDVEVPGHAYYRIKYTRKLKVDVGLKHSLLSTNYVYNEYNTLLPFTKYDFYIHYVKQNGVATNGYYIGTKEINRYCKQYKPVSAPTVLPYPVTQLSASDNIDDLCWYTSDANEYAVLHDSVNGDQWYKLEEITTNDYVIIPAFNNIKCPKGYVSCFISYVKHGNNVAQGYNCEIIYDSTQNSVIHKIDCLELNSLLYNKNKNIEVRDSKGNIITTNANYYPSGTTQPVEYLGGSGHVEFVTGIEDYEPPLQQTPVTTINEWHPSTKNPGWYDAEGTWHNSVTTNNVYRYQSTRIDVSGHDKVTFLGYAVSSSSVAYGLKDANNNFLDGYPKTYTDTSVTSAVLREYTLDVRNAKYLICVIKNGDGGILQPDSFYCYLKDYVQTSYIDDHRWLILDSVGIPYNKQLIKLTPFIKLNPITPTGYEDLMDVNSPGYYCEILTLYRDRCTGVGSYYVSGNDIYERQDDSGDIKLELVDNRVEYYTSNNINYIFSNYNLNYVSLTSDLTPIIRRYNIVREGDTDESHSEEGEIQSSSKQFITLVNSLLASHSLELKSFYREYTRKLYQAFTKDKLVKFDNTIRVSSIDTDEIYRYIYRFEASDYYNIPTQRGIITNLIAVANTLYVHCEHSLFKFTDNKTLNTQQEDVVLQENDLFNSGISEVFDAQYGYGGLKHRHHSLVTFNAYVFYDSITNIVYAFGGEQQIVNIGESIQKLINSIKPTDVLFAADEINDRFFVNFKTDVGNVCLSFNFRNKAFVGIHDIDFTQAFHSRRHTYFVHDNKYNDDIIGWSIYRITDKLTINNTNYFIAYQNCYTPSLISISDMPVPTGYRAASACVDVITNVEYEKIKTLNYINWICSEILDYGNELNFKAEEELNRLYTGDKLRIYSDSSSTALLELTDENGVSKLANEQRNIDSNGNIIPVKESWQYPVYNCGVFSLNYFRNIIKNGNVYTSQNPDLFDYKNINNVSQQGLIDLTEHSQRLNLTQENSLIYGKYFIVRLIFTNRNFKIENITFRMNDYGKTK